MNHDEVGDDCSRQVTFRRPALANRPPALAVGGQARTLRCLETCTSLARTLWNGLGSQRHTDVEDTSQQGLARRGRDYLTRPAPLLSLARDFLTKPAARSTTSKLPIPVAGDIRSGGCRFRSAHTQVGPAYLLRRRSFKISSRTSRQSPHSCTASCYTRSTGI